MQNINISINNNNNFSVSIRVKNTEIIVFIVPSRRWIKHEWTNCIQHKHHALQLPTQLHNKPQNSIRSTCIYSHIFTLITSNDVTHRGTDIHLSLSDRLITVCVQLRSTDAPTVLDVHKDQQRSVTCRPNVTVCLLVLCGCPYWLHRCGQLVQEWRTDTKHKTKRTWQYVKAMRAMELTETSIINLLKTKRNLLYIRNQSVPRCKHFPTRL